MMEQTQEKKPLILFYISITIFDETCLLLRKIQFGIVMHRIFSLIVQCPSLIFGLVCPEYFKIHFFQRFMLWFNRLAIKNLIFEKKKECSRLSKCNAFCVNSGYLFYCVLWCLIICMSNFISCLIIFLVTCDSFNEIPTG